MSAFTLHRLSRALVIRFLRGSRALMHEISTSTTLMHPHCTDTLASCQPRSILIEVDAGVRRGLTFFLPAERPRRTVPSQSWKSEGCCGSLVYAPLVHDEGSLVHVPLAHDEGVRKLLEGRLLHQEP